MTEFGISPEDLRRLARLVEENGLSELRYEEGDLRVTLRTAAHRPAAPSQPVSFLAPGENGAEEPHEFFVPPPAVERRAAPRSAANQVRVEAPVMGVFYRSPAPGEAPYVEVGDFVEAGQPVGLIEAMKVFSEVLAEVSGLVAETPARNGALVHPGDVLLVLEESEP